MARKSLLTRIISVISVLAMLSSFVPSAFAEDSAVLESITSPAAVSGIPYARAKSAAVNLPPSSGAYSLGNYLPKQVDIVTDTGVMQANVTWEIASIPNSDYATNIYTPQTFNVSGTVTLPEGVVNTNEVPLTATISVSVDGGKKAEIPWTAIRPTIDDSDLWDNAAELSIGDIVRRSANHPAGKPTVTATANVLWDDENLYVRLNVVDDDIVGGTDHECDGAEVFMSENLTRGNQAAANMNQYRLTSIGAVSFRNTTPTTSLISVESWRRVTKNTDDGYALFWAIPLLHDNGPVAGKTILLDIMINEATRPQNGRTAELAWSDSGWNGFNNSYGWGEVTLVREGEARNSILVTAGANGTITPSSGSGKYWIPSGSDQTFTVTPAYGYVVDTVTVNGELATLTDNKYTFLNVTDNNNTIAVTFKPDPSSKELSFIVWNDNFASGEFTTAVIIDLGEGNEAIGSSLNSDMFAVTGKNTRLVGGAVAFSGPRNIARVYANDVPSVLGYIGPEKNSPDYQTGLESGRYIVVELEFWTLGGGQSTLDDSNSTVQNYGITSSSSINLVGGSSIDLMYFTQTKVVNTILDKFTKPTGNSVNRALYLHKDADGNVQNGLPLYVYTHGMGRGGANSASDQLAPLKSANGATALMMRMEKEPEKFASHVLALAYNGVSAPSTANVKIVIDALVANGSVDPNRIYVAGFSWGGQYTNQLINAFPGFFAAAAPMSPVGSYPTAANAAGNKDLAYWAFVNRNDGASYQTGVEGFINNALPLMNDVKVTRFDSNSIFVWPYDQWSIEQAPPFGTQSTAPHEVEASVLYNKISEANWNIKPTSSTVAWDDDYDDIFSWMFDQTKGEKLTVSSDAHLVKEDGYFNVSTEFTKDVKSNTAILNFAFDTGKFEYSGFTPATGVQVISGEATADGAKIVVMVPAYDTKSYGDLMLHAKKDVNLENADNVISVVVNYVAVNSKDEKEIRTASAKTKFTTVEPGPESYTLIDLSNVIDLFGTKTGDSDWAFARFYDFNGNGIIDIDDIAVIASNVK